MTRSRIAIAAGFAYLAVVYCIAVATHLHKGPSTDEVEYLHVAWRMAHGERIFIDFAEHHSPIFFAMLAPLAPEGHDTDAMLAYTKRARVMCAIFAAIGTALAAWVVWRGSGRASTALLFTAVVLAARTVWLFGYGDIRHDTPAFPLWIGGAAMALIARRPALRGLGLGLVFCAMLVSPRWPYGSVVIGILFLIRLWRERRGAIAAIATAILIAAAGIAVIALISPLDVVYFHVIEITRAMRVHDFAEHLDEPAPEFWGEGPPLLHVGWVLAAAVPVIVAWRRKLLSRFVPLVLAMLAAALLELRFFHHWPHIAVRYYLFWTFGGAMLMALVPQALEALLPRVRFVTPAALVLALLGALNMRPLPAPDPDLYWVTARWIERQLGPEDTVWMEVVRHPIGVRDASYYWFSYSMHASLKLARTPRGARYLPPIQAADLPLCRFERGLEPNLRFFSEESTWAQPEVTACFKRLRARGVIEPSGVPGIWRPRR